MSFTSDTGSAHSKAMRKMILGQFSSLDEKGVALDVAMDESGDHLKVAIWLKCSPGDAEYLLDGFAEAMKAWIDQIGLIHCYTKRHDECSLQISTISRCKSAEEHFADNSLNRFLAE